MVDVNLEINDGDKVVSYSQFSMYRTCPKQWELAYGRKLRKREPNVYFVFGNAIHSTMQMFLENYHSDILGKIDIIGEFGERFVNEFDKSVEQWGSPFSSPEELKEFYEDGVEILLDFQKNVTTYFNKRKFDYIGYEVPLICIPVKDKPTVKLVAYLDLVFWERAKERYHIDDIKTSTRGWSVYQKLDINKTSQVILYKHYLSTIWGVDLGNILSKYFIVVRKLNKYSRERIQTFIPPQSNDVVSGVVKEFEEFINSVYTDDGEVILDREYKAISGKNNSNCKFCEFADNDELCPKIKRSKF